MKNKNFNRNKINDIDNKIMELLNERFNIVKQIGFTKKLNNEPITDKNRELQVLQKTNSYSNSIHLNKIYKEIINESKVIQLSTSYLVGKSLPYSFSKTIHHLLGNENYELYETDDFKEILKLPFTFINVTNPYKTEAYNICTELSDIAKETKAVNTIIKKNNKLYGFNTDYLGFKNMIDYYKINLKNKKIAILGNGGTKNTVVSILNTFNPKSISVFSRHPINNEYSFDEIYNYNPNIIVNITSYNVYPNFEIDPLIDITKLNNLDIIIDLNYNPTRCCLGLNKNIKYYNGLYMLVSQAEETEKLVDKFFNQKRKSLSLNKILDLLLYKQRNIILIGMPFSGKTTLASNLGKSLNMPVYDTDKILSSLNKSLDDVINNNQDINTFRLYEQEVMNSLSKCNNSIISLGGGSILNSKSMTILAQNGIIVYLDIPLTILKKRNNGTRLLSKDDESLNNLYLERKSIYEKYADITLTSTSIEENINKIKELIHYDNFNN